MGARVVVLHGYGASPRSHWFPWLARTLARDGVEVGVPAFPGPDAPVFEPWIEMATAAIGLPDASTVVVGHSLGCPTALHALDRLAADGDWELGSLVLVSGFDGPLAAVPEVASFTAAVPDYARLLPRLRRRVVIASDDDTIVPPAASADLAGKLDAELITMPGAGHFLGSGGFTELPLVAAQVRQALAVGSPAEPSGS